MKSTTLLLICLLIFSPSAALAANTGFTQGGHLACQKKKWLLDMLDFITEKKKIKFRHYLESGKCFIMSEEVEVLIKHPIGIFGKSYGFMYNKKLHWTDKDGIKKR